MGTVKVTNIEPIADNGTVTLGGSGDTIALASGVKNQLNRPAFFAYSEVNQTISDNVWAKLQFDTELYDTDSAFDSTTNYRFTVPSGKGGKYFFYTSSLAYSNASIIRYAQGYFYLNGSQQSRTLIQNRWNDDGQLYVAVSMSDTFDLSAGDYIEVYNRVDYSNTSGNELITTRRFGGYRIGD